MSSLHQICLYLSLITILSLANCTPWQSWNNKIIINNGTPVNNFTIPNAPSYWFRNYGAGAVNTTYTARKNQYLYLRSIRQIGTCNLYCGPRSFLVTDIASGLIACQRDNTANYWGGILDTDGNPYSQFCIPNVDPSATCSLVNSVLNNMGTCDPNNIPASYNATSTLKSCCFLNTLKSANKDYVLLDEVDFTANTTYTDLLDSEFI